MGCFSAPNKQFLLSFLLGCGHCCAQLKLNWALWQTQTLATIDGLTNLWERQILQTMPPVPQLSLPLQPLSSSSSLGKKFSVLIGLLVLFLPLRWRTWNGSGWQWQKLILAEQWCWEWSVGKKRGKEKERSYSFFFLFAHSQSHTHSLT